MLEEVIKAASALKRVQRGAIDCLIPEKFIQWKHAIAHLLRKPLAVCIGVAVPCSQIIIGVLISLALPLKYVLRC